MNREDARVLIKSYIPHKFRKYDKLLQDFLVNNEVGWEYWDFDKWIIDTKAPKTIKEPIMILYNLLRSFYGNIYKGDYSKEYYRELQFIEHKQEFINENYLKDNLIYEGMKVKDYKEKLFTAKKNVEKLISELK